MRCFLLWLKELFYVFRVCSLDMCCATEINDISYNKCNILPRGLNLLVGLEECWRLCYHKYLQFHGTSLLAKVFEALNFGTSF